MVSAQGLETLSPDDVVALRFGISGLILLPLLANRGFNPRRPDQWLRALFLAAGAGVPYVLLALEGMRLAPASPGSTTCCAR